jgi:hypothetical protein
VTTTIVCIALGVMLGILAWQLVEAHSDLKNLREGHEKLLKEFEKRTRIRVRLEGTRQGLCRVFDDRLWLHYPYLIDNDEAVEMILDHLKLEYRGGKSTGPSLVKAKAVKS